MVNRFSTRQAAKKLGIGQSTLAHYLEVGKIPMPESVIPGERPTHVWTEKEIENLRALLPKIANGRKTRYKKQAAVGTHGSPGQAQQSRQARDRSAKAKGKTKSKKKK